MRQASGAVGFGFWGDSRVHPAGRIRASLRSICRPRTSAPIHGRCLHAHMASVWSSWPRACRRCAHPSAKTTWRGALQSSRGSATGVGSRPIRCACLSMPGRWGFSARAGVGFTSGAALRPRARIGGAGWARPRIVAAVFVAPRTGSRSLACGLDDRAPRNCGLHRCGRWTARCGPATIRRLRPAARPRMATGQSELGLGSATHPELGWSQPGLGRVPERDDANSGARTAACEPRRVGRDRGAGSIVFVRSAHSQVASAWRVDRSSSTAASIRSSVPRARFAPAARGLDSLEDAMISRRKWIGRRSRGCA